MEKLIEILENYTEADEITADSLFKTDLGLSSFDIVCIIEDIASETGVKIEPKAFVKRKTVGEMADYIASLKK